MKWIMLGAVFAGLGITLGAFGAHGLDRYFKDKHAETEPKIIAGYQVPASWKYLQDYKTGVEYQMYHAFGLLAVGFLALRKSSRSLEWAGWMFVAGIVLFSGALYVLTIGGPHWLGVTWGLVAPFGGTAMIVGWILLAIAACPCGGKVDG